MCGNGGLVEGTWAVDSDCERLIESSAKTAFRIEALQWDPRKKGSTEARSLAFRAAAEWKPEQV